MATIFAKNFILMTTAENEIEGRRVLEVGSAHHEHESIQPLFLKCSEFISIDLEQRFNTTHILNAEVLIDHFGVESFDFIVSLFTLEHVKDWRRIVSNLKRALKIGGTLIIAVPTAETPYHDKFDAWRFELHDLQEIFSDLKIQAIAAESISIPTETFIYLKALKPEGFVEKDLGGYPLYNISAHKRC